MEHRHKDQSSQQVFHNEPIWELQESAIVGNSQGILTSSNPDTWWLARTRDDRQDAAYKYYIEKIYSAGQTLDLIDRWDIHPQAGEHEWFTFVGRLSIQADQDDASAAQKLADGIKVSSPPFPPKENTRAPEPIVRRYSEFGGGR